MPFGVLSCTLQSLFKAVELLLNFFVLSNCGVIPSTPTQLPRSKVCLLTGILNKKPFCQYCSSQPSWKKNCHKWKSDLRITVEEIYALVGKGSRELQWPDLDQLCWWGCRWHWNCSGVENISLRPIRCALQLDCKVPVGKLQLELETALKANLICRSSGHL